MSSSLCGKEEYHQLQLMKEPDFKLPLSGNTIHLEFIQLALMLLRSQALIQADSSANPLISSIKKSEEKFYQKVLYNMYDVYNDSKQGTLSAWSWPSRCMATNAAIETDKIEGKVRPHCPKLFQAQYTNPVHHQECLRNLDNMAKVAEEKILFGI